MSPRRTRHLATGARILLADDHEQTRHVFDRALQAAGHRTLVLETGSTVDSAIAAWEPDLVILDNLMPGRNGAEIACDIRADPHRRGLPIIIATGDLLPEAATPLRDPLTRYLAKPVDFGDLHAAIAELLPHLRPDGGSEAAHSPGRGSRRRFDDSADFESVLAEARSGDEPAFEWLFRRLAPRIRRFGEIRSASSPHDLVNDVLLKIFTRLDQFEGNEAQFNAWVFRAVRNELADQARKRAARPCESLVARTPESAGFGVDDPAVVAVGNAELDSLIRRLDVLTEEQREVVLLRVVADLSVASIAELLDRSPGSVKALQRRAFTLLASSLEPGRAAAISS